MDKVAWVEVELAEVDVAEVELVEDDAAGDEMDACVFRQSLIAFLLLVLLLCFSPDVQAQGDAALFKAKCAVCHGANGDSNTAIGKSLKLRDLRSSDVQKQTDAQLTTITGCGKGKMPAYREKLTGDQINQVVAYIRTLAANK